MKCSARALGILFLALLMVGCATLRAPDTTDYGRFPADYEQLIEESIAGMAANDTRTVTSVTEPVRAVRDDIAGWGVWARIRESRPNAAGGIDISERDCYFLIRDGRIVLSDHHVRD
jgi:hypothetical protein